MHPNIEFRKFVSLCCTHTPLPPMAGNSKYEARNPKLKAATGAAAKVSQSKLSEEGKEEHENTKKN
jgi:hypothetical protein